MDRETRDLERRLQSGDDSALMPLYVKHVRSGLTHLEAMDAIWLAAGATVDSIPDLDEFAFERELELGGGGLGGPQSDQVSRDGYPVDAVALCEKVGIQPGHLDELVHDVVEANADEDTIDGLSEDAANINNSGLLDQLTTLLNARVDFADLVRAAKNAGIAWPEIGRPSMLYVRRGPYVSWIGPEDKAERVGNIGMIVMPRPNHSGAIVTVEPLKKNDPKQVVDARLAIGGWVYDRSIAEDVERMGLDKRLSELFYACWWALSEDPEEEPFTPPVTPLESFWTLRRGLDYAAISGIRQTLASQLLVNTPDSRALTAKQVERLHKNHEVDYVNQRRGSQSFEELVSGVAEAMALHGDHLPRVPEQLSLDKGSLVWDPAPRMRNNSGDEDLRALERKAAEGDEAARVKLLHEQQRRGVLPKRVTWLQEKLKLDLETAGKVAGLMADVDADPYGYNPSDRMDEIATILGGSANTLDSADGDEPWFLFVSFAGSRDSLDVPTLVLSFRTNKWSVQTERDLLGRVERERDR